MITILIYLNILSYAKIIIITRIILILDNISYSGGILSEQIFKLSELLCPNILINEPFYLRIN